MVPASEVFLTTHRSLLSGKKIVTVRESFTIKILRSGREENVLVQRESDFPAKKYAQNFNVSPIWRSDKGYPGTFIIQIIICIFPFSENTGIDEESFVFRLIDLPAIC